MIASINSTNRPNYVSFINQSTHQERKFPTRPPLSTDEYVFYPVIVIEKGVQNQIIYRTNFRNKK
jgi:hypothetical protein